MTQTDPSTGAAGSPDPGLLDAAYRYLPNPLFMLDARGRVVLWNAAAEALFGQPAHSVLGQALARVALPAAAQWLPLIEASRVSGVARRSAACEIDNPQGTRRWLEFSATPLPPEDGAAAGGTLVVADDVSDAVRARARAEADAAELQAQAERRDRFFSAMSHDLRTPITAVLGYSELLLDGVVGEMPAAQREMVSRIFQVAGHLSQLLNDTLDLARLDAGRMEFHPEAVELRRLVHDAVVAVEPQAQTKGLALRVELEDDELLYIDAGRVQQILVNLLANAIKFTEEGETLVRAGRDERRVWVTVRDTGPGLPEGAEEAVFEEFIQIASGRGAKKEPGSGLGLAISRRLARALGGELVVRSHPGAGASFTLWLPRRAS